MTSEEYVERLRSAMRSSDTRQFTEDYIEECCAYAENLLARDLPVLFNGDHVHTLFRLYEIDRQGYHEFYIPKRNGGMRSVVSPSRPLKQRQRWILKNILSKLPVSQHAQGFVPKRSIVTNASRHKRYRYTLCVDIENFFPSIRIDQVTAVFCHAGYTPSAAGMLASLCCHGGQLPQGAPTSPCISNIICRDLDRQIAAWATLSGAVYSRYADDISISGNGDVSHLLPVLSQLLLHHNFTLNTDKTRFYDENQPKRITGLTVHDSVRIPKRFKRKLRQEIYYCKKYGVTVHLENTKSPKRVHYREHLYGKAYYVKMVEPDLGDQLLQELSTIQWPT